jgi:hypothetical protein
VVLASLVGDGEVIEKDRHGLLERAPPRQATMPPRMRRRQELTCRRTKGGRS